MALRDGIARTRAQNAAGVAVGVTAGIEAGVAQRRCAIALSGPAAGCRPAHETPLRRALPEPAARARRGSARRRDRNFAAALVALQRALQRVLRDGVAARSVSALLLQRAGRCCAMAVQRTVQRAMRRAFDGVSPEPVDSVLEGGARGRCGGRCGGRCSGRIAEPSVPAAAPRRPRCSRSAPQSGEHPRTPGNTRENQRTRENV